MQEQDVQSVLSGRNAGYIAHLYGQYLAGSGTIDPDWQTFFGALNDNEASLLQEIRGASWTPEEYRNGGNGFAGECEETAALAAAPSDTPVASPVPTQDIKQATLDSIRALMLIRAYRVRGHFLADLDPLGMKDTGEHPELDPAHYEFTDNCYDRPIFLGGLLGMETATLQEIMDALRQTYCGRIGVEYTQLSDPEERAWIQQRIEAPRNRTPFGKEYKRAILERLTAAEGFEKFLHTKHTGAKRFGVDGGEALIPALEEIIARSAKLGVEEVVIGMAHRGRLNVLANIMGKSYTAILSEFQGKSSIPEDVLGSGDVKYHLGTSSDQDFDGNMVHLSLTANPSHLEAVNPVVVGKVRAKQSQKEDTERQKVMPLLLHGDAAFAGQGLVAETLMIADLPGYRVGGTVHVVINNQIGFTTMPQFSRSGPYPTDVAKLLEAPIFHVNGDDPESVVHVARIAAEFRQEFGRDVVVDMVCYRRFGHNEGDEPAFTQPLMYKTIKTHETTRTKYAAKLVEEGTLTGEEAQKIQDDFNAVLEKAFEETKDYKPGKADFLEGAWEGLKIAHGEARRGMTAISEKSMQKIGKALTEAPEGFHVNSKIARQLEAKKQMLAGEMSMDWAMGEALAFGSLVDEGYSVRLSGQDAGRGTFSHRHAILHDQENEEQYVPLQHVDPAQEGVFEVHNSPLSEAAVLGFEYGYSLADPKTLVLWEAQFGDFTNGAQVLIDQFISSGESKWLRMSGLTMLLPHGYEGQGPEHSSARPERFLMNGAEDNWQVVNCTTPANFFHVLRRQMHRDFRKPLVVFTPKSLLRHKLAVSPKDMFLDKSSFHRILWDDRNDAHTKTLAKPDKIRRVVLCTGKVYYDLFEAREAKGIDDVLILRLEQLYPFPLRALAEEIKPYKNAEIVWCQEEPKNMGYWYPVGEKIEESLLSIKHQNPRPRYIGRTESAAPATGLLERHQEEQAALLKEALG